jgi:Cell division protein CrgA
VHDAWRPHHLASVELPDALVAEAHAEDGNAAFAEGADGIVRHASVLGSPGSWRHEDGVGRQRLELRQGDLVVAMDDRLGAQLPQVLDEVVNEGVVVVDHHHARAGHEITVTRPSPKARRDCRVRSPLVPRSKSKRSRYTPPPAKKAPPSKLWVPATMFTMLVAGVLVIVANYLQLLPGGEAENRYLFVGLGLFTGGAILSTQLR